jgi:hypothetical protein
MYMDRRVYKRKRMIFSFFDLPFGKLVHMFLKFWFAALVSIVLVILGLILPIAIIGMAFEVFLSS